MNHIIDINNITLHTERLTLRPFRKEDLTDFNEYARVDGVGQMAGWPPHKDLQESERILTLFLEEKKTFAVEYQGKVIGSLGVEAYKEEDYPDLSEQSGREIGYVLAKDYWGRGFMAEAVKAVMAWLFEKEGLDFVLIGHFDWNSQSARVIEKCGLTYLSSKKSETLCGTVETVRKYIAHRPEEYVDLR